MNKKILIGSIIAVVILVLVSFTSVIGYRSISSDVKVSPLFNIRSSKAIGKESRDLSCDYVGKGITLPFPERDDRGVLITQVINRISKMDEKKFNRFVKLAVSRLYKENKIRDRNIDEAVASLYQIRNDKIPLSNLILDKTNDTPWTEYPVCTIACTIDHWIPTCAIYEILWTLVGIILSIYCIFIGTFPNP